MKASTRPLTMTWIGLLVLLGLTLGSAYFPLGRVNLVLNLGIAVGKAVLVGMIFMHLRGAKPVIRVIAVASIAWLLILVGLGLTNYVV